MTPEKPAQPALRESSRVAMLALYSRMGVPLTMAARRFSVARSQQVSFMKRKRPMPAQKASSSSESSHL